MHSFHSGCIENNVSVSAAKFFVTSGSSFLQDVIKTEFRTAAPFRHDSNVDNIRHRHAFTPQDTPLYKESTMPRLIMSPESCFVPFEKMDKKLNVSSPPFTPSSPRTPSTHTLQGAMAVPEKTFDARRTSENISFCQEIPKQAGFVPVSFTMSSSSDGATRRRTRSLNEKDDTVRQNKVKTELCMNYVNNNPCPFGEGCTYAHGEEELQLTKLMDLHRAGLADVETYRTKPCLTWVSTGSCPFGIRCTGIHDPRVAGTQSSWLPHTETQGNTIDTDINVESLHQKRLNAMLHNNPFGEQFSLDLNSYEDLYNLICNTKKSKKKRSALSDRHKIEIALKMRGGSDWQFKFRPQHIIYDEVCMVLQKRAFRLTADGVVEIPLDTYNDQEVHQVVVCEIAFGPDSDATVRPVSLWFNIADQNVKLCTPQQAKRYRYSQDSKKLKKKNHARNTPSLFDNKDSFVMIRPLDKDSYDLSTDILCHRLKLLQAESDVSVLCSRAGSLDVFGEENEQLAKIFQNLRRQWVAWSWPMNRDSTKVDDHTPVPKVDAYYSATNYNSITETTSLLRTNAVWNSFITSFSAEAATFLGQKRRLPVFETDFEGLGDPACIYSLPHIARTEGNEASSICNENSKCWKALLIRDNQEADEWEMVKDHFDNSRSKKVLTILQQ